MVLDEILIPEFVKQILASVFLQRLHVVEDGMPQQQKVTLIGVEHVQGSPPVTPCELASSELGRAWLMG
jgi:hypothetical protein